MLLLCLFNAFGNLQARTYPPLIEAIKEHQENPSPETEAKLEEARRNAKIIDFAFTTIPLALGGYIIIRLSQSIKNGKTDKINDR